MQTEQKQPVKIKGYLYVLIQKFNLPSVEGAVSCHLSISKNANCQTQPYPSGNPVNEVFLIEVPDEENARLVAEFKRGEEFIGDCRFDINPFFEHVGAAHSMTSEINGPGQQKKGTINIKVTFFSAEAGKLRIRVFHLSLVGPLAEHYKQARLKIKIGIFAQSSTLWDMTKDFDQTLQLVVLLRNSNLEFDVIHEDGILAQYQIYDLQKSGLLVPETKAYQVSLFNKDKAVGTIKYQIDWIR